MDFYADIIRIAKAELDSYGINYADISDDRHIVERWVNVYLKLIKPQPRHVLHSAKVVAASHEGVSHLLHEAFLGMRSVLFLAER